MWSIRQRSRKPTAAGFQLDSYLSTNAGLVPRDDVEDLEDAINGLPYVSSAQSLDVVGERSATYVHIDHLIQQNESLGMISVFECGFIYHYHRKRGRRTKSTCPAWAAS